MAGLVPAIHVFSPAPAKTWMPDTRPSMTSLVARNERSEIRERQSSPELVVPDFTSFNPDYAC